MTEVLKGIVVGLPVLWAAQTLLAFRDYFSRRSDVRRMPPITQAERSAIEKLNARAPIKEKRSVRSYLHEPGRILGVCMLYAPLMVLFWPMLSVWMVLPKLDLRLSEATVNKIHSGEV
jgi:hypothetical protein